MKKLWLLFLALSLTAVAQTLIGLPEYGITLSGSAEDPILTNHSGKTIVASMLVAKGADGRGLTQWGAQ